MDNEGISRKDKMANTLFDTATDSVTEWGNDFIKTNVPRILDCAADKTRIAISTLTKKNNIKNRSFIRDAIYQGIEIGEENKERALVMAMKEMGTSDAQINQILEISNKFLVTLKEVDEK